MAHTHHQTKPDTESVEGAAPERLPPALAALSEWLPDWPGIAGFLAVTLVVFLVGSVISSGVEQLVRPPTAQRAPVTAAAPPTTAAGAVTETPATTLQADESTATDAAEIGPAVIELSTEIVDFGAEAIAGEFDLSNTGDQAADCTADSSSAAIAFSAPGGSLRPGETVTLRVSLDRSLIAEGEVSETITISWSEGETEITATATHEDNPIIHNPQASPTAVNVDGEGCSKSQTTVTARVRDTSEIASVVVRWSPDGTASKETQMSATGDDMFEGVVGPFTEAQTATLRIVAFDDRGNAGGASLSVTVDDCP